MGYTDEQRADAVTLCLEVGMAEAHDRTGIPKPTLSRWLTPEQRAEMAERFQTKTAAATRAHAQTMEQRRAALASDLMDDVQKIRTQLFAPCVERKAMIVSQGKEQGSEVEVVDIERERPTFGDQQRIMTTLAIAVDKVQVLTGEATERIDHRHGPVPERTPEQEHELDRALHLVRDQAA